KPARVRGCTESPVAAAAYALEGTEFSARLWWPHSEANEAQDRLGEDGLRNPIGQAHDDGPGRVRQRVMQNNARRRRAERTGRFAPAAGRYQVQVESEDAVVGSPSRMIWLTLRSW